jgi:hypothetical protein
MASEIKVDTIVNAGGDNDSGIDLGTNDTVKVTIAGAEKARFDSNGRLGIGTTSPDTQFVVANGSDTAKINLDSDSIDFFTQGKTFNLGTTDGTVTRFFQNNSERMRIDTSGAVLVGTTNNDVASSSGTGNEGHVFPPGLAGQHAISNQTVLDLNRKTSDGVILNFRKNGSQVGTISTNGNTLPSDKNFKRDIKDLNIGLDLVSQLQPKSFNTIVDDENSPVMYGLIAQDLEVALEKVGVTKNSAWILQHEEKNNAKESDYSLDYGKLIPILINAIKELQEKVTALESK